MNANFMFSNNIKLAHLPVDLNTAAVTGARVKLDKGERLAIVCAMGDSTAATSVQFTLRQHNAASAGTSKDLLSAAPYYHKVAAATVFTKVVPTVAAALKDVTSLFANDEGTVVIEVLPEELDVNNGFAWVSVDIADAGAAKIGATFYVIVDSEYKPAFSIAL